MPGSPTMATAWPRPSTASPSMSTSATSGASRPTKAVKRRSSRPATAPRSGATPTTRCASTGALRPLNDTGPSGKVRSRRGSRRAVVPPIRTWPGSASACSRPRRSPCRPRRRPRPGHSRAARPPGSRCRCRPRPARARAPVPGDEQVALDPVPHGQAREHGPLGVVLDRPRQTLNHHAVAQAPVDLAVEALELVAGESEELVEHAVHALRPMRSARAVEPTRSQKSTVTCLRRPSRWGIWSRGRGRPQAPQKRAPGSSAPLHLGQRSPRTEPHWMQYAAPSRLSAEQWVHRTASPRRPTGPDDPTARPPPSQQP